MLHLSKNRNR